jgi:hypothetical protein
MQDKKPTRYVAQEREKHQEHLFERFQAGSGLGCRRNESRQGQRHAAHEDG